MGKRLSYWKNRLLNHLNSEIHISIFNFRTVQKNENHNLPRQSVLKGQVVDESNRTIGKAGSSKHITHPEGWLMLVGQKTDGILHTELMQLENSKEHVIVISDVKEAVA